MTDTNDPFKQFEGIAEAKDVHVRPITVLEKLIKVGDKVIKEYEEDYVQSTTSYEKRYHLYLKIKEQELCDVVFNDNDITAYLFATMYREYDKKMEPLLHGYFTGCLLSALTERNAAQGKGTRFYINGNGNRFDHLFNNAQFVDELIVENFAGEFICNGIGYYGTRAKRLVGINIQGGMHTFANSRGRNTHIEQLVLINISGEYPCVGMSNIDQVIAINVEGKELGHEGSALGFCSNINQLIALGIKGSKAMQHNSRYKINQAILEDIAGANILCEGSSKRISNAINQLIYSNVPYLYRNVICDWQIPIEMLSQASQSQQSQLQLRPFQLQVSQSQASSSQRQHGIIDANKIRKTLRLARSMPGKPYQEVLRIADELYALRPEVPKRFFE